VHVVLFRDNGNQFVAENKGYDQSRYGDDHIFGKISHHAKDTGIPALRGLAHFGSNRSDLCIDIIEKRGQVTSNHADEEVSQPILNRINDSEH